MLKTSSIILSSCLLFLAVGQDAYSQIIYSVGTQEIYDSNIYLEDGATLEDPPQSAEGKVFQELDGKENGDLISSPYVSAAGRLSLTKKLITNYSVRLGSLIYSDTSQENKATIDGTFSAVPEEGVLPAPWTIGFTDSITSQATTIGVSQGGATRQGQLNNASLYGGFNRYQVSSEHFFTAMLSTARQDFLGQFLFNDTEETERRDIEGVDSFSHSLNLRLDQQFNDRWSGNVGNNFNYLDITGGDSNTLGANSSQLDRFNDTPSIGVSYSASDSLKFSGQTGYDFTSFSESQDQINSSRDRTQSSFFYGGNLNYRVSNRGTVTINALQSAGTDIDGDRLIVRNFGIIGTYLISDRISSSLSAQFSQFTQGDTLSDPTQRYEFLASMRYAATDTVGVGLGYSFSTQDRPDESSTATLLSSGDFDVHRVFVSVDTGFVGVLR